MLDLLKKIDGKKTGIFAAGVLFGTAGVKCVCGRLKQRNACNITGVLVFQEAEKWSFVFSMK